VLPLLKQGRPSGDARKNDDVTSSERGNSASYLVRKLKRARPEIADALARGEYPSARAAAKAAGLVKEKSPLDMLRHWWRRADEDERRSFMEEVLGGEGAHRPS
jgi:hypothetical protein